MLKPGCIDLSHWNEIIGDSYSAALASLQRTKEAGVIGLIHKATESTTYKDDHLKARCDLARDAGLLFGTYHFLRPTDIGQQVAFYYDTVMSVQKLDGEADQWLWCCDYEDPNINLDLVADFCEQLDAVTGHIQHPVLYTGFALKDKIKAGQSTDRLAQYKLWLAHYATNPTLPEGWDEYFLWQYSDKASVPGIEAPTDVNAFDGSAAELESEWVGFEAGAPPPVDAVTPEPGLVDIAISVPEGIEVSVTVNGKPR